jgi:uncharacterized protein YciI
MFAIILTYTVDLTEVDAARPAHLAWLDQQFADGVFIAAGPQVPRTGGLIIAGNLDRARLQELLDQDPYHTTGVATYNVIEFNPVRTIEALDHLRN